MKCFDMSRIGRKPIGLPQGVEVTANADHFVVKGKKGELRVPRAADIEMNQEDNVIRLSRSGDEKHHRQMHGTTRALLANAVHGVSEGFEKRLEIIGVGYRGNVSGNKLVLSLGFSHPVELPLPSGVSAAFDTEVKGKIILVISGIDAQAVGEFAANVRKWRPPEPYKGKGIRYLGEHVQRKAGKSAGK